MEKHKNAIGTTMNTERTERKSIQEIIAMFCSHNPPCLAADIATTQVSRSEVTCKSPKRLRKKPSKTDTENVQPRVHTVSSTVWYHTVSSTVWYHTVVNHEQTKKPYEN